MLIDGPNNVYMADRDHAIYHVPNLTYWKRKDLNAHLASTLVDGVRTFDNLYSIRKCIKSEKKFFLGWLHLKKKFYLYLFKFLIYFQL